MVVSVSSVSAEFLSDDDSLNPLNHAEISDLSSDMGSADISDLSSDMGSADISDLSSDMGSADISDLSSDMDNNGINIKENDLIEASEDNPNDNLGVDSNGEDNLSDDDNPEEDPNDNPEDDPNEDDNGTDNDTLKNATLKIISQSDWKVYDDVNFTVKLLDEDNHPIENAKIDFKIKTPKGTYISKSSFTNQRGIAILTLNLNLRGIHNIQVSFSGNSDYNPAQSVDSNVILYEKTVIKTNKYAYRSCNLTIRLVSKNGNPIAKKKIVVYVNKIKYVRTTDSKGRVFVKMPSNKRTINLNCRFSPSDYYEESNRTAKLPVYKKTYTKPLIYAIFKGKCFKILLKGIDGKILKKEKVKFTINGKNYTRTTNKKGIAYIRIHLKRNEYKISFSYGNNSIYGPSTNSSILNVIDPSGQFKRGLNQKTRLSAYRYLSGGGYAKVTKSIKKKSRKITRKYSTKLEKATAIFNYVRDTLGYSYYANSRKGASKTLKTKFGNCCDHTNLIVALCRASKIPARYAHAQGCRFSDGSVEGHVWAQIYVGGRWYSADGTSYRNSLGHVSNWNTKSYNRLHIYRNIPF